MEVVGSLHPGGGHSTPGYSDPGGHSTLGYNDRGSFHPGVISPGGHSTLRQGEAV